MFLQTKEIITQQEYTPSVSGGDVENGGKVNMEKVKGINDTIKEAGQTL